MVEVLFSLDLLTNLYLQLQGLANLNLYLTKILKQLYMEGRIPMLQSEQIWSTRDDVVQV